MTDDRLPLAELVAKAGDDDFLRVVAESVLQIIMEADVDGLIGAGRHERSGDRTTWRNGYRERSLDTRLRTLNLKIPKLRTGAYFPWAGARFPGTVCCATDRIDGVGAWTERMVWNRV